MLTSEQESDLVEFISEDFGNDLNHDDFIECCLQMFEDIAGLEYLDEDQTKTIVSRLWRQYAQH